MRQSIEMNRNHESNAMIKYLGTASLMQQLDRKVMVQLYDGRIYFGILRSYDQYLNIVLTECVQRLIIGKDFCDMVVVVDEEKKGRRRRTQLLIRGDQIAILGEVDEQKEQGILRNRLLVKKEKRDMLSAYQNKKYKEELAERQRMRSLQKRGMTGEYFDRMIYDE